MIESKYNIGDTVLVRADLTSNRIYGGKLFVCNMIDFRGEIVTITEILKVYDGIGKFYYRISNCDFWWSDEMFVGVVGKVNTSCTPYEGNHIENVYFDEYYNGENNMPNIKNYTYNPEIALTTIEWADGTKTTVRAENPNTADQYTGFVTAVAKKVCGNNNTINNLFDEWAIKRPARELKKQILNNERLLEEKRIEENHRAKMEKYLIRKEARRLKREYEAKKLANEKYGVPMEEDGK